MATSREHVLERPEGRLLQGVRDRLDDDLLELVEQSSYDDTGDLYGAHRAQFREPERDRSRCLRHGDLDRFYGVVEVAITTGFELAPFLPELFNGSPEFDDRIADACRNAASP